MIDSVEGARRRFADDLRTGYRLGSDALVKALARVPRERFLGPGPWLVRGERDRESRATEDDDPRQVYQNASIAIDASKDLYNGQPGLVAGWLDQLAIRPDDRVLHIGGGTGYYSALMAELTGPGGHVTAIEVDPGLAARAQEALTPWPWVTARQGDGRTDLPRDLDVVLVHAGATHVLDEWLDVIRDGGRLLVPLTCTMPGMPPALSKGMILVATRQGTDWMARVGSMVMIYALVGARDDAMNARLGQALMRGNYASVVRLRRDPHEPGPACWLHGSSCLTLA